MQRDKHDIFPVVEDLLGAVAVVVVDVEHGHLRAGGAREVIRDHRRVVEEAVAAVQRARGMVTRWPAQPVGGALPGHHEIGRGQGDIDR